MRPRGPEGWIRRLDQRGELALIVSFEGQFISSGESAASVLVPNTSLGPDGGTSSLQAIWRACVNPTQQLMPHANADNGPLGCAPVASSVQITYDKLSDPVLIEISLGLDEPATDAEDEVLTQCSPALQTG